MNFENYEAYKKAATEYYSSNKDLKVPVAYMILSEEMFKLFNGTINFGLSKSPCNGNCQCECKKENN